MEKKKIYRKADLKKFETVIKEGINLWAERCYDFVEAKKDQGTCVLGAGIAVDYIPPRCRTPRRALIIDVHRDVITAQGSLVWEDSVKEVLGYLRRNGINCWYHCSYMD